MLQSGMTVTFAYNTANELLTESFSGGTLDGLAVTNTFDPFVRHATLAVLNSSTPSVTMTPLASSSRQTTPAPSRILPHTLTLPIRPW